MKNVGLSADDTPPRRNFVFLIASSSACDTARLKIPEGAPKEKRHSEVHAFAAILSSVPALSQAKNSFFPEVPGR